MMVDEVNPLIGKNPDTDIFVSWTDPCLSKITRLRLLTDRGCPQYDVSYCVGVLKDGRDCYVGLGFHFIPRSKAKSIKSYLIDYAKEDGVYAKGLGLLDDSVISILF